jgi:hypothetical protein
MARQVSSNSSTSLGGSGWRHLDRPIRLATAIRADSNGFMTSSLSLGPVNPFQLDSERAFLFRVGQP